MRDELWDALKAHGKEVHAERMAKMSDRIGYAKRQFQKHGIRFELVNELNGQFKCWRKSDGKMFQFFAGTGKIQGSDFRGIKNAVRIMEG